VSEPFIPLLDFIPALSPKLSAPVHLRPLTSLIQRMADGESVRAGTSVPPRNGKTVAIMHGCSYLLARDPSKRLCYATYSDRLAQKKSRSIRQLARRAGVPLAADAHARSDWRTDVDDGGMWATSPGGSITGEGFDYIFIDDPIKGRAEAESGVKRESVIDWLIADVLTRLEPNGSVLINGTRWHPEDPIGYVIGRGWEFVNLQAITPAGTSLWPERWPLSELHRIRETMGGPEGYEWLSLYCGNPRGRGARVFGDVHTYDALPDLSRARISIGLDFGYSSRTAADASVAVVLAEVDGVFYVLDVVRVREEPRAFRGRVQLLNQTYLGAWVCAYAAATEMGGIEFLREGGIAVDGRIATVDKFTRAIPVAAAWNTGKVLLPHNAPWLNAFVSEICGFSGVKDRHDDQVDALAAAFDALRFVAEPFNHAAETLRATALLRGARDNSGFGVGGDRSGW